MCATHEQKIEQSETEVTITTVQHVCSYCGSTQPLIPYEQMYGPGANGWDCCPDCGGV